MHEWSPRGASRFLELVRAGYYDGVGFTRVVPGFLVQVAARAVRAGALAHARTALAQALRQGGGPAEASGRKVRRIDRSGGSR